ncbi:hypothetical protein [Streptomyces sp. NPDC047000]|uniref:hypothetical protein n=1 Tax=Streptomyces sp. NPDC047000 TaxID=3155474 RepID=UPI0033C79BE0
MDGISSGGPRRGRHRRIRVRGGRRARYAVGGLALAAGTFEVAYLIAGATVGGGGDRGAGGLGAAEAPSRPPGGEGRGAVGPGAAGVPADGGAAPGVRPSATSLLLAGTSLLPGATVTPSAAPAATTAPERPGTAVPRSRPGPTSGPGAAAPEPTGAPPTAPTTAPGATPGTGGPAGPSGSPPHRNGSGSGSGSGICVPVIGLCVDPLLAGDGLGGHDHDSGHGRHERR